MSDPTGITNVDKDLFERVWALLKQLHDREKQFNDLQTRYRTLASTWLLAAFAGIGFVLSKSITAPISNQLMAMFIALAGAAGIMLLWVLDVLLYHDLLIAGYVVGKRLEELFLWLPPVRSNFSRLTEGTAVRWYIAAFYISGITILCLIASANCWFWRRGLSYYLAGIVLFWLVLDTLIVGWTKRALKRKRNLPPWPLTKHPEGA